MDAKYMWLILRRGGMHIVDFMAMAFDGWKRGFMVNEPHKIPRDLGILMGLFMVYSAYGSEDVSI